MHIPNLFIVGAAKAGTTSLYHYLQQHPDIYMSPRKEPHFFSGVRPTVKQKHHVRVVKDLDVYESLFSEAVTESVVGEASPSYLWSECAAQNIYTYNPDAKIIILLRHPVHRAHSHYLMDYREGRQAQSFYDALIRDYEQPDKGWGISHLYVELGMYYRQVERYMERFPGNTFISTFENFVAATDDTLRQIMTFLGVRTDVSIDIATAHNVYAEPRGQLAYSLLGKPSLRRLVSHFVPFSLRQEIRDRLLLRRGEKQPVDPRAKEFLLEIYNEDVKALQELLGYNVGWDLN